MARRWLVKTHPDLLPLADLADRRARVHRGVTSPPSLTRLRRMRRGDDVLLQHTGHRPSVIGVTRVRKGPHPDPEGDDPEATVVTLAPIDVLPRAVPLKELRGIPALADWELLTFPRLSVASVPAVAWHRVLAFAKRAPRS